MLSLPTTPSLSELLTHALRWLANLRRAKAARIRASREALQQVVLAARETAVYVRQREQGIVDHKRETELTRRWTALGFQLQSLGLCKLAKRCDISGRYWANPEFQSATFIEQADIKLERMELLARQLLAELGLK